MLEVPYGSDAEISGEKNINEIAFTSSGTILKKHLQQTTPELSHHFQTTTQASTN